MSNTAFKLVNRYLNWSGTIAKNSPLQLRGQDIYYKGSKIAFFTERAKNTWLIIELYDWQNQKGVRQWKKKLFEAARDYKIKVGFLPIFENEFYKPVYFNRFWMDDDWTKIIKVYKQQDLIAGIIDEKIQVYTFAQDDESAAALITEYMETDIEEPDEPLDDNYIFYCYNLPDYYGLLDLINSGARFIYYLTINNGIDNQTWDLIDRIHNKVIKTIESDRPIILDILPYYYLTKTMKLKEN